MPSVHGHEVLHMMLASGQSFTTASLIAGIKAKFGEETRFHTCSATDLSAEQLVAFLAERGKFIAHQDGFNTSESNICQH